MPGEVRPLQLQLVHGATDLSCELGQILHGSQCSSGLDLLPCVGHDDPCQHQGAHNRNAGEQTQLVSDRETMRFGCHTPAIC